MCGVNLAGRLVSGSVPHSAMDSKTDKTEL